LIVRVRDRGENYIEIELPEEGHTLCNLLVDFLNRRSDVEYAAYTIDHPLIGVPRIFVRTKGNRRPEEVIIEAIDEALTTLDKLDSRLRKALHESSPSEG